MATQSLPDKPGYYWMLDDHYSDGIWEIVYLSINHGPGSELVATCGSEPFIPANRCHWKGPIRHEDYT